VRFSSKGPDQITKPPSNATDTTFDTQCLKAPIVTRGGRFRCKVFWSRRAVTTTKG